MNAKDFANYIDASTRPVTLEIGKFTFTFTTDEDYIVYNVTESNGDIVEYRVSNKTSLMHLANEITRATHVDVPDEDIAVSANIVSVVRTLTNLLYNPVDYELDEEYANFIERINASKQKQVVSIAEVDITFTYNDNMLHVKFAVPNKYCNVYHIGVEGKIDLIANFIKNQCEQLELIDIPSKDEIKVMLDVLGAEPIAIEE